MQHRNKSTKKPDFPILMEFWKAVTAEQLIAKKKKKPKTYRSSQEKSG